MFAFVLVIANAAVEVALKGVFIHMDNQELMRVAREQEPGLRSYVDGHNLGYVEREFKLYDGQRIGLYGDLDFSQPAVREMYERSGLLSLNDLFLTAQKRGLMEQLANIWGTDGMAHVIVADPVHKSANSNRKLAQ